MFKHFTLCLILVSLLGCAVNHHEDFSTWQTDGPFRSVSFWKMLKNPEDYTYKLLTFEAVTKQVSNDSVMLETNRERIAFTIKSGGAPVRSRDKDGKQAYMRLNQKYKFRCRIIGIQHRIPPGDRPVVTQHIYADFILTPDNKKVLYQPILVE